MEWDMGANVTAVGKELQQIFAINHVRYFFGQSNIILPVQLNQICTPQSIDDQERHIHSCFVHEAPTEMFFYFVVQASGEYLE